MSRGRTPGPPAKSVPPMFKWNLRPWLCIIYICCIWLCTNSVLITHNCVWYISAVYSCELLYVTLCTVYIYITNIYVEVNSVSWTDSKVEQRKVDDIFWHRLAKVHMWTSWLAPSLDTKTIDLSAGWVKKKRQSKLIVQAFPLIERSQRHVGNRTGKKEETG